ncbi:hypothetical protein SAMN04489761_4345 [Tenacibaculum sp. MAR_2009_124]|uniref:hypothetical protein n=1 Tax=Tenacibaculum sp. MAR_2009_124 TaxID=1250059 RepID=UPI00089B0613|nr:hypothetical protein [Tenacibaculum sp. MAR_2009_124]SED12358.1 hypothetical protein SAMN04489761_4345 [Tenacibaculum sp. MAR_2009_124]
MLLSVVFFIIVLLSLAKKKTMFYEYRLGKKKIISEFEKYEFVTVKTSRNNRATTYYPFVRIFENEDNSCLIKLNYLGFFAKEFKKSEKVAVF